MGFGFCVVFLLGTATLERFRFGFVRYDYPVRVSLKFVLYTSSSIYKHHRQDETSGQDIKDRTRKCNKNTYVQHKITEDKN